MELKRIEMLETVDTLFAGHGYNLPETIAENLVSRGKAKAFGPLENKAIVPEENKTDVAESVAERITPKKKSKKESK